MSTQPIMKLIHRARKQPIQMYLSFKEFKNRANINFDVIHVNINKKL